MSLKSRLPEAYYTENRRFNSSLRIIKDSSLVFNTFLRYILVKLYLNSSIKKYAAKTGNEGEKRGRHTTHR